MKIVKVGDIYKSVHCDERCVINNVIRKGKGFTISYIPDGYSYALTAPRAQFLKMYHQ